MAWNPDENLPDTPLLPHERQATRRILKWYERRVYFRASARVWVVWLGTLPPVMLAVWGLVQLLLHGK